jgi:hypothetical protein
MLPLAVPQYYDAGAQSQILKGFGSSSKSLSSALLDAQYGHHCRLNSRFAPIICAYRAFLGLHRRHGGQDREGQHG